MPYAVSEQMIEAYGDLIFDLSLNKQVRRGDPIRLLDHAAWQAQREQTGLTDPEIAGKTGLACEQVTFIRNIVERRRFRPDQYRKLFRLGGSLRHREERYQDPEIKFEMGEAAKALRRDMRFDANDVARFIHDGYWSSETLLDLFDQTADDNLKSQARQTAGGLLARGLGRGDVVAGSFADSTENLIAFFATVMAGGIYFPIAPDVPADALVQHAKAHCLLTTLPEAEASAETTDILKSRRPAAADPVILLLSPPTDAIPRLAIHTHQTMISAVRNSGDRLPAIASLLTGEGAEVLSTTVPGVELREDRRQVRGPTIFAGYFNNPDADNAHRTTDGWFILKG